MNEDQRRAAYEQLARVEQQIAATRRARNRQGQVALMLALLAVLFGLGVFSGYAASAVLAWMLGLIAVLAGCQRRIHRLSDQAADAAFDPPQKADFTKIAALEAEHFSRVFHCFAHDTLVLLAEDGRCPRCGTAPEVPAPAREELRAMAVAAGQVVCWMPSTHRRWLRCAKCGEDVPWKATGLDALAVITAHWRAEHRWPPAEPAPPGTPVSMRPVAAASVRVQRMARYRQELWELTQQMHQRGEDGGEVWDELISRINELDVKLQAAAREDRLAGWQVGERPGTVWLRCAGCQDVMPAQPGREHYLVLREHWQERHGGLPGAPASPGGGYLVPYALRARCEAVLTDAYCCADKALSVRRISAVLEEVFGTGQFARRLAPADAKLAGKLIQARTELVLGSRPARGCDCPEVPDIAAGGKPRQVHRQYCPLGGRPGR